MLRGPYRARYKAAQLAEAFAAVRGGMPIKKAAQLHGVPKSTLHDRLKGKIPLETTRSGPASVLTSDEEELLVQYIVKCGKVGYPITKNDLRALVKKLVEEDERETPFIHNIPGEAWFKGFLGRHPSLKWRTTQELGYDRMNVSKSEIYSWYGELQEYLISEVKDESLLQDPKRIFNCDESGFPLQAKKKKVLAMSGSRNVYQATTPGHEQVTVLAACNAAGMYCPPYIIFKGMRLRNLGLSGFEEATYSTSESGWMKRDNFLAWLQLFDNFITENTIERPVLLYLDGHTSHLTMESANFAHDNNILLYCLPPHSSHIMQPLDVGVFSRLKAAWHRALLDWQFKHPGMSFNKSSFPGLFKEVWDHQTDVTTARNSFHRAGLFPLDPTALDTTRLISLAENNSEHSTPDAEVLSVPDFTVMDDTTNLMSLALLAEQHSQAVEILPSPEASVTEMHANDGNCQQSMDDSFTAVASHYMKNLDHVCSVVNIPLDEVLSSNESLMVTRIEHRTSDDISLPVPSTSHDISLPVPSTSHDISIPVSSTSDDIFIPVPSTSHDMSLPVPSTSHETSHIPVPSTSHDMSHVSVPSSTSLPSTSGTSSNCPDAAPAFKKLNPPQAILKKKCKSELPKAASGKKALEFFASKALEKKEKEVNAMKRKLEREEKKRVKEEEKEKKQKMKKSKSTKRKVKQEIVLEETSEEEELPDLDKSIEVESFDRMDYNHCTVCGGHEDGTSNWVGCDRCPRWTHISCSNDPVLKDLKEVEDIEAYQFFCMYCNF